MKILFWSISWDNFGDEFSPWLIPRMLRRLLICVFKWHDWMATIGLEYNAHEIHKRADGRSTRWWWRQEVPIRCVPLTLGADGTDRFPLRKFLAGLHELAEVQKALSSLICCDHSIQNSATIRTRGIFRVEASCKQLQQDIANFRCA